VKVCDFGVSKIQNEHSPVKNEIKDAYETNTTSTFDWMAPEFMERKIFTEKSEVYSFAILMFEILSEEKPYPDL
jgi:serine/threonine protein kinase